MANAADVVRLVSNATEISGHDHQILFVLISCPDEKCRRRAIGLFGQPTAQHQLEKKSQGPTPGVIDAHQQLPGDVREYDLPPSE